MASTDLLFSGGGGGLSEAVAVPWDAVLPLPDNVELDTGGKTIPRTRLMNKPDQIV